MTIAEVYERYKHLDGVFTNPAWKPERFEGFILRDLWLAVKAEMEKKA